ncbi:hypothetical protein [Arthrobacter woluwensis]|uniref:hypothetical protein n=1 Tax=Arthrobacter woluwensis TaxID=156980 RepID=UPI00380974C8
MSTPEFNNQGGPETPDRQHPGQSPWGPPGQQQAQQQAPGQYQGGPQGGGATGTPYGGGQGQQGQGQPYGLPSQGAPAGPGTGQYGHQPGVQQHAAPQAGPDYGRSAPGPGYAGPGYAQTPAVGRGAAASQQPDGGKALLGPLTLRDVLVLVAVVLLLVSSGLGNFGRLGFIPSLEFLGIDLILPLAVGVGFVVRRVSPSTKLRLGSFSLDQLASVLASLALLGSLSQLGVLPFLGYFGYINWTSVILSFLGAALLFVTTVLARFIPVFAADFTGRPEVPAHVVARDAAPANRPAQPVHSGPGAQQYSSAPGYGDQPGGPAQGAPSPYAPQGYQPQQGQHGQEPGQPEQQGQHGSAWAAPAAGVAGAAGAAGVGAAAAAAATGTAGSSDDSSAGHPAPGAESADSPAEGGVPSPYTSRHRAPEAPEGTSEGLGEGVGEVRDAGSAASPVAEAAGAAETGSSDAVSAASGDEASADEPSAVPAAGAADSGPAPVSGSDADAGADAHDAGAQPSEQSSTQATASDPILGDEVLATAGYEASEGPSEDDLLKEAQSHVAEAPELPEPVLGVPTLNESVDVPEDEEEEFYAPHPDDDSDVTVLRSALNTGGALSTGSGSSSADKPESTTTEDAAPAGAGSEDPIHAVVDPHREAEQPAQQAFWFAVPELRVALDERSGAPVFDLEPGKWILALQEGPQGLVVQNEDGRIGVLHDLRNIERGS